MSLIKDTEKYLNDIVHELGYRDSNLTLQVSGRKELGQYQINVFSIAKCNNVKPFDIASAIISKFDNRFVNVNIAGMGFINVSFNNEILINYLNKGINDFSIFIDKMEPKTIIVDYGGANAAKALHVGHMRSANIGESIKRLAKLLGNNVIGDVHLGDLGRQAGMLISELMIERPDLPFFDPNFKGEYPKIDLTTQDLGRMYPKASMEANKNEDRMELVRKITSEIDKGNIPYTNLWKQMVEISSKTIKEVYDELNCHFELWEGELDAFKYIPDVLKIMKPYLYESEGALVLDVKLKTDTKEMPPLMVIKKDGSTIYGTRDLGTLYSRITRFNPDEIWYVVDQRQSLYFEQVFRGSYKTKIVPEKTKLVHYDFGTINGIDGKPFKTRDGGVMELSMLIDMIKDEIKNKIKDDIKGAEREEIISKLAIATLKYTDLLPYRKTDYVFDPIKFSSLEGKTGPYILYTLVRIKSLLKKVDDDNNYLNNTNNQEVLDILVKILEIPDILNKAYRDASINYIAEFLYEISSLYNKFYNNNNILKENDTNNRNTYIALTKIVYSVMHNLLDVLAIEEVDRM